MIGGKGGNPDPALGLGLLMTIGLRCGLPAAIAMALGVTLTGSPSVMIKVLVLGGAAWAHCDTRQLYLVSSMHANAAYSSVLYISTAEAAGRQCE